MAVGFTRAIRSIGLGLIIIAACQHSFAQGFYLRSIPPPPPGPVASPWEIYQQALACQRSGQMAQEQSIATKKNLQLSFLPTDPFRMIGNHTELAKGNGWVQFTGRVSSIADGEVSIQGRFWQPCNLLGFANEMYSGEFSIRSFPYRVEISQRLDERQSFVAFRRGTNELDYGLVADAPLQFVKAFDIALSEGEATELRILRTRAASGDACAQYKLGVQYLRGEGVETNTAAAMEWLSKSATQGNREARELLARTNLK
jgi:hypothetical protein